MLPDPPQCTFASDNASGASPEVLQALCEANEGYSIAYGDDDYTNEISRNLGIRIITRSYEKTYNDQESTEILNSVVGHLTKKFSITLNEKVN